MKLVQWGLTGGIAAGKSIAAERFRQAGISVIDLDALGRHIMDADAQLQRNVEALFSEPVVHAGKLDRKKIRKLVFEEGLLRKKLEALLHPAILAAYHREAQALAQNGKKIVLCEAALLVEGGREKDFEGLIVVDAPRAVRKQRLTQRDGIPEALAEQILNSQCDDDTRLSKATVVLKNAGTRKELEQQVDKLVDQWKKKGLLA